MTTFPEFIKLDVGIYIDILVKWLLHNFDWFFDPVKEIML
jgi:glycine betaine/proline transport system permease protein